jgi:hypothetical protein
LLPFCVDFFCTVCNVCFKPYFSKFKNLMLSNKKCKNWI